jgi:hypothetical protein
METACAMEERFQKVLKEAVDKVMGNNTDISQVDPVYSAAREAAEMARRQWWSCSNNVAACRL